MQINEYILYLVRLKIVFNCRIVITSNLQTTSDRNELILSCQFPKSISSKLPEAQVPQVINI